MSQYPGESNNFVWSVVCHIVKFKNVLFQNPENLPVENVIISVSNAGVVQNIKALVSCNITSQFLGIPIFVHCPIMSEGVQIGLGQLSL